MFKVGTLDALGGQLRPWRRGQPLLRDLDGLQTPSGVHPVASLTATGLWLHVCLPAGYCSYRGFHR